MIAQIVLEIYSAGWEELTVMWTHQALLQVNPWTEGLVEYDHSQRMVRSRKLASSPAAKRWEKCDFAFKGKYRV